MFAPVLTTLGARLIVFFWEELSVSTYMANPQTVERTWYVIDGEGLVMGRLASHVASMLRGKHKPTFTPHVDCGDFIIVVNSDKLVLTGRKLDQKMYRYHTGYPGGLKEVPYRKLMQNKSPFAFREAVRRMLPKGPLGYKMLKKLHVYAGPEHGHEAQKPVEYKL